MGQARSHLAGDRTCVVVFCIGSRGVSGLELAAVLDVLAPDQPALAVVDEYREWVFAVGSSSNRTVPLIRPYDRARLDDAVSAAMALGPCRRRAAQTYRIASYGPIELHLDTDGVSVAGRSMPRVRGILYRLLRYMVLHAGAPITLDSLERDVWRAKISARTLESHLSRLRSALGPAGAAIVTLPSGCALLPPAALAENTTLDAARFR